MNSWGRLDPPVPDNYFGNCCVPCVTKTESVRLVGADGFLVGVELIGEDINKF